MSQRKEVKRDALAESAARLFSEQQMSYGQIGKQLGLTKKQAKSKVWAGLNTTPQLARQEQK